MSRFAFSTLLVLVSALSLLAGGPPTAKRKSAGNDAKTLTLVEQATSKSQGAGMFVPPLRCDHDGNVYLLSGVQPSSGILKLNRKGELVTAFRATSATDLSIMVADFFTIGPRGDIYQIASPSKTMQRAILNYASDGTYKSSIKLDTPPGAEDWDPYQVGVFSSGDLLISGLIDDATNKISYPFTGVFSSSGQFRKEVSLSDDEKVQKMVQQGDPRLVSVDNPYSNRAVSLGQMLSADDGNLYLMRNAYPPIFYVISPAGELVRHFTVNVDGRVLSAHISGHRIALVSEDEGGNTNTATISVVDLEGKPIATYRDDAKHEQGPLGNALACYTSNPDRFTFLGTTSDGYLQFKIAEPQ